MDDSHMGLDEHTADAARGRDVAAPGFRNLRDVGGYPLVTGGVTRWRKLLRGDFPFESTTATLDALRGVPVGVVVDLRGPEEIATHPSPFADGGMRICSEPVFEGSAESFVAKRFSLEQMYRHLVLRSGSAFARVAGTVAQQEPTATLVHCTAGKDRTGVAIALILSAVGVDRGAVIADYADTERHFGRAWTAQRIAVLQRHHTVDLGEVVDLLSASPAEAIGSALELVDQKWGSPERYLRAHGLERDELASLRERLIEPCA